MTSEAARFNDLEGVFRAAVGDWGAGPDRPGGMAAEPGEQLGRPVQLLLEPRRRR
ncbi:hypothetical protein ACFH04_08875 [Streptomyces noboritoensis]|uniref:Uncharacterized protein n=1 Tax=Streptomyces noboritoensis TaxID=67337 RepID=A0ABV6TDE1_9ACTN